MRVFRTSVLAGLAVSGLWLGGCPNSRPTGSVYELIQSEDPSARIDGIVRAGQSKDPKAVPLLVDRLSDSEPDVRLFAFIALRKITGETLGYKPYAPEDDRDAAVRRWREHLKKTRGAVAATRPSGAKAS